MAKITFLAWVDGCFVQVGKIVDGKFVENEDDEREEEE